MFWKGKLQPIAHPQMFAQDELYELHELDHLALGEQ